MAEVLADRSDDFGYANLAIRGRKLPQVLAEQLEPALALRPDLVTIYAGGNDILRPKVDIDGLIAQYDHAVGRLVAAGAHVVMFTGFDLGFAPVFRHLRGRVAVYNELVREVADDRGATVVDFWRMRELRDPRYWDTDRMHLSTAGHERMAQAVLAALDGRPLPGADLAHTPLPTGGPSAPRTLPGLASTSDPGCSDGCGAPLRGTASPPSIPAWSGSATRPTPWRTGSRRRCSATSRSSARRPRPTPRCSRSRRLGRLMGARGHVVVTGGLGGVMAAAVRGARGGGHHPRAASGPRPRRRRARQHRGGPDRPRRDAQRARGPHRRRRRRGRRELGTLSEVARGADRRARPVPAWLGPRRAPRPRRGRVRGGRAPPRRRRRHGSTRS